MPGVRAEPKYLRDPTSLETLSSGLSRLSSYVTSNLPKIKTSTYPPYIPPQDPQLLYYQQQLLQQQRLTAAQPSSGSNTSTSNSDSTQHDGAENITIASFEKIDTLSSGTLSCLLLGYDHGFQLWDVSQPDNVHEIASIRNDILGSVIKMRVLSNPAPSSSIRDSFAHVRPLLAIICSDSSTQDEPALSTTAPLESVTQHHRQGSGSSSSSNKKYSTSLHLYSLKTHEFIPTPQLNIQDDMVFTDIKSNGKAIALGCKSQQSAAIYLFSSYDLSQMYTPLTDVYNHRDGPVFTMGSRFIAYATTLPVLNNDTSQLRSSEKDVKGAAKDIAKEMVNGVKTLGEFGYHRLSNYFSPQQQQRQHQEYSTMTTPIGSNPSNTPSESPYYATSINQTTSATTSTTTTTASPSHPIVGPTVPSSVSTNTSTSSPVGMVIIRDITKLPKNASSSILSLSTVAHFKPHMHPVAILAFNAAGNLLMSISKQGHTFHIFSLYPTDKHLGNAAHLYNLSRGYTDAQVEDCQFSIDSTWCAVTTARGTTHMYTINPYGGKPEINSHVNGKINNLADLPFTVKRTSNVTSLGPAVRVKQRRPMPADPIADDLDTNTNIASNNSLYPQSVPSSASASSSSSPPPPGIFRLDINFNSQRQQQQHIQQSNWPPFGQKNRANLTTMFLSVARVPQQLQPHSTSINQSSDHDGVTRLLQQPTASSSPSHSVSPSTSTATTSLASIRNQASTIVSQVSSYLPSTQRAGNVGGDWTSSWAKDKTNENRMFGFDEEESSLDNDDLATKMTNDNTGYQDVYSFHPQGILTLHRLWITKNMVRKKVHGRTVGKWDLSVKEEDIAEWQIARNQDWAPVGIPIYPSSSFGLATEQQQQQDDDDDIDSTTGPTDLETADTSIDTNHSKKTNSGTKASSNKKKRKQKKQVGGDDDNMSEDIIDRRQSQQQHQQRHINQWLSHAEIMTYPTYPSNRASNNNNSHESPLWTNPQFSFQVYTDEKTNGATIRHLLSKGIVPPTQTVAVRSETPEPYTSRINRVGKTSAKARSLGNQEEEYMDDALAELEESLSTAMQTSFVPSSSSASPRRGIRLSSSAGAATHSSSAMASTTGFTSLKKASNGLDRTSSLSFEDAYLISMGGAPVYRSSPNSAQQPPMDDDVYQTIVAAPTHLPLQDSALIQFDSDDDTGSNITSSNLTTLMNSDQQEEKTKQGTRASYSSLDGSFDIQGLGMSDEMTGTSRGEMVFSPDGDNEMGGPSDSMMFDG